MWRRSLVGLIPEFPGMCPDLTEKGNYDPFSLTHQLVAPTRLAILLLIIEEPSLNDRANNLPGIPGFPTRLLPSLPAAECAPVDGPVHCALF
jgi:hypothetical protein